MSERAERLAFLLSEARDGPWHRERRDDGIWLANEAGDSLLVSANDVADLVNDRLAAVPEPALTAEDIRRAISEATPLNNPRLSEVPWDEVAARLSDPSNG